MPILRQLRVTRPKSAMKRRSVKFHAKTRIKSFRAASTGRYIKRRPKSTRNKVKITGGYNNQQVSYKTGRKVKLTKNFIAKCRESTAPKSVLNLSCTSKVFATPGTQNWTMSPMMYQYADILNIADIIDSTHDSQLKFTITSSDLQCRLCNSSNGQGQLMIYECQAREDVPYTTGGVINPYTYLTSGWGDEGLGVGTDLSVTPFQSAAFCSKFKIVNVKTLKFNPGEEKIFRLTDDSIYNVNMNRWKDGSNQLLIAIRRKCKFLLFRFNGQVAASGLTGSASAQIGTTELALNSLFTQRYTYWYNLPVDPIVDTVRGITADGINNVVSTPALPVFIQEMTGQSATGTFI